jgi:hypothetical protein
LGVTWLTGLCLWPDSTEPGTPGPGRIERAGGLVACAGVLAVIRIAYLSLSAFMLRRIVTDIAVVSAVAVCGALLGVAMTNRLGRSRQNRSGPAPWLGFSGPRCLLILLLVGLGAVIGRFGLEAVWLSLPALPEPVVDPGALVGGLVAFLLVAGMARSGHAAGPAALEALDLAMGFIHVAVPTGLLLFLAAALLVDRLGGGYPVFLVLMYGPLVAGTLGMLGRAWRLYHPLPGHEWAVVAWGWAVSGFFALKQTESLGRIFNLTETIPAVLLVSPLFLILLAFLELFGHEDAETSPARQSTPANAQGPGQS